MDGHMFRDVMNAGGELIVNTPLGSGSSTTKPVCPDGVTALRALTVFGVLTMNLQFKAVTSSIQPTPQLCPRQARLQVDVVESICLHQV